jgi:hypothetical protein
MRVTGRVGLLLLVDSCNSGSRETVSTSIPFTSSDSANILDSFPRKTVAVCSPAEYERRPRLFRALEQALPVRFEGRQVTDHRDVDAVILIANGVAPELMPAGLPCFVATGAIARESVGTVHMRPSTLIDAFPPYGRPTQYLL